MKITAQETATILSALRLWQEERRSIINGDDDWMEDSYHFMDCDPLTPAEVDSLCERINHAD